MKSLIVSRLSIVIPFDFFSRVLVINKAFDMLDHAICEKVIICWLFKGFHIDILLYSKNNKKMPKC